jgi:hypothetical protein
MNKFALPIIALISLSIGFAICSVAYVNYTKTIEKQDTEEEKTVQHKYEMPNFVPAVWLHSH